MQSTISPFFIIILTRSTISPCFILLCTILVNNKENKHVAFITKMI